MLHEAFVCWSHLSVEQETTVTCWQSETIYRYWQAAANTVSLPQGVCLVIPPMHLLTCDTRRPSVPSCRGGGCACQKPIYIHFLIS